jgi:hypothetical protein
VVDWYLTGGKQSILKVDCLSATLSTINPMFRTVNRFFGKINVQGDSYRTLESFLPAIIERMKVSRCNMF